MYCRVYFRMRHCPISAVNNILVHKFNINKYNCQMHFCTVVFLSKTINCIVMFQRQWNLCAYDKEYLISCFKPDHLKLFLFCFIANLENIFSTILSYWSPISTFILSLLFFIHVLSYITSQENLFKHQDISLKCPWKTTYVSKSHNITTAKQGWFLIWLTGFILKTEPILPVKVVEKDACCLSVVYATDGWLITEGENDQARALLYRNFLFNCDWGIITAQLSFNY